MKKATTLMLGTIFAGASLFAHSAHAAEGQGFFNSFSPGVISTEKAETLAPKAWNLIPTLPVEQKAEAAVQHGWATAPAEDAPSPSAQTTEPVIQHAWNLIPTLPVVAQPEVSVKHGWTLAPAEDAPAAAVTTPVNATVQHGWNWNVPSYNSNKE